MNRRNTTLERSIDTRTTWSLGSTKNRKVIHRPLCTHARRPYTWAGCISERELLEKLLEAGSLAIESNDACHFCAGWLRFELHAIRCFGEAE